jgi:hypothetical protein
VATTFTKTAQDEFGLNRKHTSSDPKEAVAIGLAKSLVEKRGKITDEDLDAVRAEGYLKWLHLSLRFLFTNFMNNVAETQHRCSRCCCSECHHDERSYMSLGFRLAEQSRSKLTASASGSLAIRVA